MEKQNNTTKKYTDQYHEPLSDQEAVDYTLEQIFEYHNNWEENRIKKLLASFACGLATGIILMLI